VASVISTVVGLVSALVAYITSCVAQEQVGERLESYVRSREDADPAVNPPAEAEPHEEPAHDAANGVGGYRAPGWR
jgi:hypothetical protein